MTKINKDYILKTFLNKIKIAKREGMKELKIPVSFLDDLAYIIYQLMSENISSILDKIEIIKEEEKENTTSLKKNVFKEIKIDKKPVKENIEIKVEPAIIEEVKNDNIINNEDIINNVEDDENDEDEGTILYGGSW